MLKFDLADGRVYRFDEKKMLNTEAMALQNATGFTLRELLTRFKTGDVEGLTAYIWLAMRRAGEQVKYSEVEFDILQVKWEHEIDPTDEVMPVDPSNEPAEAPA